MLMRGLRVIAALLVGGSAVAASGIRAEQQQQISPGCAKIVAVLDQGGGLSADEVAKKTNSDVETVRTCTDLWRRTMKGTPKP
jgi:transposase